MLTIIKNKTVIQILLGMVLPLLSLGVFSAQYNFDKAGMHGFIEFKVSHLGYSILGGRFNEFDGNFNWDKSNPGSSSVEVTIQTGSLDTNHEERNKHLTSADFLNAAKFPTATFKSTAYKGDASGGTLVGDFTLNGVTKSINIEIEHIGEGKDPWGGYRAGFSGQTTINSSDYGYTSRMFPKEIDLAFSLEGIQAK